MIDINMQKLVDIKGGIVLDDVISRDEACKISDKSFAHGFRDKRVVMFAGNRERPRSLITPCRYDLVKDQRVYHTLSLRFTS
jgi:hypothetical protein